MSGNVAKTSISDFVYVEKSVGMKFQRGTPAMQKAALEENNYRLKVLQDEVDSIAKQIRNALIDSNKSMLEILEFCKFENQYQFYRKGMSGYSTFPTFSTSEEAVEKEGSRCYFQLHEDPVVVVRFLRLPAIGQIEQLKQIISDIVSSNAD